MSEQSEQEEKSFNETFAEHTMKKMRGMINEVDLNKIVQNQNTMYVHLLKLICFSTLIISQP
jgi:hypothetical protein